MEIITSIAQLRTLLAASRKSGYTIGFVPTMGYLHEGHLSLIRAAKQHHTFVVVSLFVNPTQFAPHEDFDAYPRDLDRDSVLAASAGADILFCPTASEIYPPNASTFVEVEGSITHALCGLSRPSHFKGVTTVVAMLLNIVQPDGSYFGQKDAQQAMVIQKMVRELHMPYPIHVCPIVRESDGLALSSRNVYLNKEQREQALILNRSLTALQHAFTLGERNVSILKNQVITAIATMPLAQIDYVELLDAATLTSIETISQPALAAVAVKFGNTRLIDNVLLSE